MTNSARNGSYEEFLRTIRPVVLGLDHSSVNLNRGEYWSLRRGGRFERRVSSVYEVATISKGFFDIQGTFELTIAPVIARTEETEPVSHSAPLRILCVFYGHFHSAGTAEGENVEQFAQQDAWVILWPYFRQFVSDATGRLAIPPETLPLALAPGVRVRSTSQARPRVKGATTPASMRTAKKRSDPSRRVRQK